MEREEQQMNYRTEDDQQIRGYLLGSLSEAERLEVEERLMTDTDFDEYIDVLEDELIDDYVRGALSAAERQQFEKHFRGDADRRKCIALTESLYEYDNPTPVIPNEKESSRNGEKPSKQEAESRSENDFNLSPRSWWRRGWFATPAWRWATAAILLLAIGVGAWWFYFNRWELREGLKALNHAYKLERPFESRLTEFAYAPYSEGRRSVEEEKTDKHSLRQANALISAAVMERADADALHASGKLSLAQRDFQAAIKDLEAAHHSEPDKATILADLGTAYLEAGKVLAADGESTKSKEFFTISQERLSQALTLDAKLLSALFNRALAHRELKMTADAVADWRAYLKQDPNSDWAREVEKHLAALDEEEKGAWNYDSLYLDFRRAFAGQDLRQGWAALRQCYEDGSNLLVERLLQDYLTARHARQEDQARMSLATLQFAAAVERAGCGDRFTTDLARYYGAASLARINRLREALVLSNQAREELKNSRLRAGAQLYQQAKAILDEEASPPPSRHVEVRIAHCNIWLDANRAMAGLTRLLQECEEKSYPILAARVSELLSTVYDYRKATAQCLASTRRALALHESTGNIRGKIYAYIQLAGFYQNLNDHAQAFECCSHILDLLGQSYLRTKDLALIYRALAGGFAARQHYRAAIAYQRACLKMTMQERQTLTIIRAYTFLAELYRKTADREAAIELLEGALTLGRQLEDQQARDDSVSYVLPYLGDAYREQQDFDRALICYDEAIEINERRDKQPQTYQAHKGKLFCFFARNDDVNTRRQMQTTLRLYEEHHAQILEDSSKISYGEQEQSIYDLAIGYEFFRSADQTAAFALAEASRGRAFLALTAAPRNPIAAGGESAAIGRGQPMALSALTEGLPAGAQLLEYAVLRDKVLIWVVTPSGWFATLSPLSTPDLQGKVSAYLQKLATADEETLSQCLELAMDLYRALIEPVEDRLIANQTLCVVADKFLHYLPFSALLRPTADEYLIEKYPLLYAPSATVFIKHCREAQKRRSGKPDQLFVVGDPSFDRQAFPTLRRLSKAQEEARAIAQLYPAPLTAYAWQASEKAVKQGMAGCTVLHLATHYVLDPQSPWRSGFLLAKPAANASETEDGVLRAQEIYAMSLPTLRVALLAGCQTGIEQSYEGEGAVGVARPFLAAGVPLVIASLWEVDSAATSELMVKFHQHYRQGKSEPEALRLAQRELLRDARLGFRHPHYWASFVAFGGAAPLPPAKETDHASATNN